MLCTHSAPLCDPKLLGNCRCLNGRQNVANIADVRWTQVRKENHLREVQKGEVKSLFMLKLVFLSVCILTFHSFVFDLPIQMAFGPKHESMRSTWVLISTLNPCSSSVFQMGLC